MTKFGVVGLSLALRAGRRGLRRAGHRPFVSRMGCYPADRLAADVLRGIAGNRAVIVSPRSVQAWWWMWRFAPPLALKLALDLTRQARRTLEETTTAACPGSREGTHGHLPGWSPEVPDGLACGDGERRAG